MSISHGVPGTAGASIPYCENIIGVIYHIPISLVHAIRRIVALEHGFFVALRGNIIIAFSLCCRPLDCLSFAGNGTFKCNAGITSLQIKHDLSRVQINAKSHAGYKVRDDFLFDEIRSIRPTPFFVSSSESSLSALSLPQPMSARISSAV